MGCIASRWVCFSQSKKGWGMKREGKYWWESKAKKTSTREEKERERERERERDGYRGLFSGSGRDDCPDLPCQHLINSIHILNFHILYSNPSIIYILF